MGRHAARPPVINTSKIYQHERNIRRRTCTFLPNSFHVATLSVAVTVAVVGTDAAVAVEGADVVAVKVEEVLEAVVAAAVDGGRVLHFRAHQSHDGGLVDPRVRIYSGLQAEGVPRSGKFSLQRFRSKSGKGNENVELGCRARVGTDGLSADASSSASYDMRIYIKVPLSTGAPLFANVGWAIQHIHNIL